MSEGNPLALWQPGRAPGHGGRHRNRTMTFDRYPPPRLSFLALLLSILLALPAVALAAADGAQPGAGSAAPT